MPRRRQGSMSGPYPRDAFVGMRGGGNLVCGSSWRRMFMLSCVQVLRARFTAHQTLPLSLCARCRAPQSRLPSVSTQYSHGPGCTVPKKKEEEEKNGVNTQAAVGTYLEN